MRLLKAGYDTYGLQPFLVKQIQLIEQVRFALKAAGLAQPQPVMIRGWLIQGRVPHASILHRLLVWASLPPG